MDAKSGYERLDSRHETLKLREGNLAAKMVPSTQRHYSRRRRPLTFGWSTLSPILFFLFLRHLAASPSASSASVDSWGSSSSEESSRIPYNEDDDDLVFTQPYYNATIPENSVGKTFVVSTQRMGIYIAPSYGSLNVRFKIANGDRDSLFKADARQVGDFCFLLIRTRTGQQGVLNREYRDWYSLKIKATMTASDSSSGPAGNRSFKVKAKTEVFVRVTDTNDLNPLFPPVGYNASLPEDTPLNQPFLTVSASDADLGVNGEIYYSLSQPTLQFAVHPTRGSVTLTRPLNYRDQKLHALTIVAEDRGPKAPYGVSKGSSTTVTVHVTPVNLHAPEISVRGYQTPFSTTGGGTICAIVRVTDKDRGPHGEIAGLAIISSEGEGLFKVTEGQSPNEYNIELDRRPNEGSAMNQEYSLTLRAVDNGTPQKESTQVVRIKLSDAFEKAPAFEKESYQAEVSEVVPINTPIIRLAVVQQHKDEGGSYEDILYHLEDGNAGGAFHLNPKTGQLSTAKPLDHETRPHYTLTVSAAHRGIRGFRKKKSVKVDVTVLDANDNDPVFNLSHSSGFGFGVISYNVVGIQFFENQEAGTVVYTARAEDRDAGENGYISYSLANLNVVPFSVDHFTGEVKTTEKLDYETSRRDYVLKVRASDWGAPYRRQAELTLRVKIRDFNDNRPQFEKVGCVVRISKKAPMNTELVTLSAIDFDHGAMVTYRLVPSNDDPCFRLDGSTGVLRLICDLAKASFREKTLNVSATDGSYFSDVMPVDIKVVPGTRTGTSTNSGDKMAVAECRDVGVTDKFKEQMRMGELNNRGGIEDDVTEPTPTRFTENRHAPEFPSALPTEIQVREDEPVGSQIATAGAKDPDHGYNGRVVHVISNGDDDGRFHLDLETGVLSIERPLDRERVPRYLLNISAYDLGAPQKSVSRIVAVRVLDVNDNPPLFEKNAYSFVVPENSKNGTSVVRLRATDADEGINAEMTFQLLTDAREFAVDRRNGLISVVGNLDREKSETYRLRVRATDSDPERPLSSTTLVSIRLKDENDNAPKFVQSNLVAKVREDLPVGSVIMTLPTHDPDLGDGGIVRYDIIRNAATGALGEDTECLSIDPLTGVIRLTSKLDFETRQLYNVTIRARDRGVPSLSSVTNLLVEVEDVDENTYPPKFPDFVATGTVMENQPPGTLVTKVTATDADTQPGMESRIVYSIRGGNGLGLFDIDDQGNIRTRVQLDADTESRYWLTVFAQDRGSAPLSSAIEVFIQVTNENDNAPLTLEPVYYVKVSEDSPVDSFVLRIDAFDLDNNNLPQNANTPRPHFKLNPPKGFFQIDSDTGIITTTSDPLDRESEAQHILEVTVSDNGEPYPLESVTRVVVDVEDINDNAPEFTKNSLRFTVPEMEKSNKDVVLCRVIAWDPDEGKNGEITYSIVEGMASSFFTINPISGVISTRNELKTGMSYEVMVKASDGGSTPLESTATVVLEAVSVIKESARPPVFLRSGGLRADTGTAQVTEKDKVGHLVYLIEAQDPDNDPLWYSIESGNEDHSFTIEPRGTAVTLARPLDWEAKSSYNLSIKVTDMVHSIYFMLHVGVWDENEYPPLFSQRSYSIDIPESIPLGSPFFQLTATDRDHEKKLFYAIHNSASPGSLSHFQVDERTGSVSVSGKPLDYESCRKHILTMEVKDQGTPAKRDYARLLVHVQDRNDHAPEFLAPMFSSKVFETSAKGTSVVQLLAVDRDKGKNAEITYSLVSGNIGGAFSVDPTLGILQVSRELDSQIMPEYFLMVRANDHGIPTLNSTVTVHVKVTQADNASPKFEQSHYSAELFENERSGTSVASFSIRSRSSVYFEITDGNKDNDFVIDSISGIVSTSRELDFEKTKFYNLTVRATNMVGSNASATLSIHVLDRNDNRPEFEREVYMGRVSESAEVGSFALREDNNPLVVKASDKDSERNAILNFEIVERFAQKYFQIDKRTGAISILSPLDHETHPYFIFTVQLSDLGRPRLSALGAAQVNITVLDVNDCAPVFLKSLYSATLLLPTYKGVVVTKVQARDPDSSELKYSIVSGNSNEQFIVDSVTGEIIVNKPESNKKEYEINLAVDDGQFESSCVVKIQIRETRSSGLKFSKEKYEVSLPENVAGSPETVCVVTILGSALNEHVIFSIRNPSPMFSIGKTSGAVRTSGRPFDREVRSSYTLVVEAKSELLEAPRIAHVLVEVTITDVNDNAPMFVNLPYHCVVPVEAQPGDLVRKVSAIDLDIGQNGFVQYELQESDSSAFFTIDSKTGDIRLKQNLGSHNTDYHLVVIAIDSGDPSLRSEVTVPVKVINRNMPVFPQQFYSVSVPENIGSQIPVLTVQATSPQGRQLIYSIVAGNQQEEFAVDFNTDPGPSSGPCVIYVVEELDYEVNQLHQLTLRATDSVSGYYAEVQVSVSVEDVNDNPPVFTQTSFNATVSESAPFGTSVLKLSASDRDTGANKKIQYQLAVQQGGDDKDKNFDVSSNNGFVSSDYFHLEPTEGILWIKQILDHETHKSHHLSVVAHDGGSPTLSSTAHIWINVLDTNDNPPKFEHATYSSSISEHAQRDQFVTMVVASDPDESDQNKLSYSIVGGNDLQAFRIDKHTGMVYLASVHHLSQQTRHTLNVSVTDGVHSAHTRIWVDVKSANRHTPVFSKTSYEVALSENAPSGTSMVILTAKDDDGGEYGRFTFGIQSQEGRKLFSLNPNTGEIKSQEVLDREFRHIYEVPVTATDRGGRVGFSVMRVTVTDANDNVPQFSVAEYRTSINANTTVGTTVLKVHASDADEGAAGSIEYSIYEDPNDEVGYPSITSRGGIRISTTSIFAVTHDSGDIYLLQKLFNLQNEEFQFFVRARDKGVPRQESHVPIVIRIADALEPVPSFEQLSYEFFLSEGSPLGTVVTTLNVSSFPVHFKLAPALEGTDAELQLSKFSVDPVTGRLSLMAQLDREQEATYSVTVQAESVMSGGRGSNNGLVTSTDILIRVMDENDNPPIFESDYYAVEIAENSPKGSTVLRIAATDKDLSRNAEISYSFGDGGEMAAGVFQLDQKTGWIMTLNNLDREKTPRYRFEVIAKDGGTPSLKSSVWVEIEVKDYNDNPTIFKQQEYTVSVNEDNLPGYVLLSLDVEDADIDQDAFQNNGKEKTAGKHINQFYITSGNPQTTFGVSLAGEVYINKPLDRETQNQYTLNVAVTDGIFVSNTQLLITILDVNDNVPVCLKSKYNELVSESIAPQTYILTVDAADADEGKNALLEFSLSGHGSEDLYIDSTSGYGLLKTAKPLDRERQSRYSLVALVRDMGKPEWFCTSSLEIILSDVNDNAPVFSQEMYSVAVPEDSQVGTLVAKVHATDPDLGMNRRVSYSFVDSAHSHFSVDSGTGIVRLQKPLDRETRAMYNLTVQAKDHGTPQLSSLCTLLVLVQDINDNPPEFAQTFYYISTSESTPPGSEVIRVFATSKDSGINAEITYTIIEGNDFGSFEIHPKSGVISVAKLMDYEAIRDYCLTILAKDGGTPPLSNQVTVNISITDANDNPPIFSQPAYFALVSEDARIGFTVIQLLASDADSAVNGKLTFSLRHGDIHGQFNVHPETGDVIVAAPLDRETVSNYVLQVECIDSGTPPLATSALVNIEVSDINDNPPLFSQVNFTAIVQEGKPIGFTILKFLITDSDAPPNDGPFKLDIISGNEDKSFRLVQQDATLRSAKVYNHLERSNYLLHIRVSDRGSPPLSSDTWVNVRVIEESKYPPQVQPLRISVSSYLDEFHGGALGRIFATDDDPYDKLTYDIVSQHNHLFMIGREDGLLSARAGLDVGSYDVNISVTDGKFTSHSMIFVEVVLVSQEAVENAVILRLAGVTPEDFILTYQVAFVKGLQDVFGVKQRAIELLSVQPAKKERDSQKSSVSEKPPTRSKNEKNRKKNPKRSKRNMFSFLDDDGNEEMSWEQEIRTRRSYADEGDLDVLFAVQKSSISGMNRGTYYVPNEIRSRLREKWSSFQATLGLKIIQISKNRCTKEFCTNGDCFDKMSLDQSSPLSITTETFSNVFPQHQQKIHCICQLGYGGAHCDVVVNECARQPCPPNQICVPSSDLSSPLLAHTVGVSSSGQPHTNGYTCQCPAGKGGLLCDQELEPPCEGSNCYIGRSPVTFSGRSYARYSLNTPIDRHLTLSLHFRTKQSTGNLMFASGLRDYSVVEILDGFAQFRFDCGSGEGIVRVESPRLNDGTWHQLDVERHGNMAKIIVDKQYKAAGGAPGVHDILNMDGSDIYFGAEIRWFKSNKVTPAMGSSVAVGILQGQIEDLRMGFVGCMDDIKIDGTNIPLQERSSNQVATLKRMKNVEFHCQSLADPGPCGTQPCYNGATCTPTSTNVVGSFQQGFICQCPPRFVGPFCKTDTDPCASDPCLNGGICQNLNNDYKCVCPSRISGKRCDYGRFCNPNPCMNKAACEEGNGGPICKCRGFHGDRCQNDVDECQLSPCARGATCINLIGSFQCHCPANVTGITCSEHLYTTSITSSAWNTTLEEVIGIALVIAFILVLAFLLACCWRYRHKRRRHRPNNEIRDDQVAGEFLMKNTVLEKDNLKRQSKVSNLEMTTTAFGTGCQQPPIPPRPLSYTPSNQPSLHPNAHPHRLNHQDSLSGLNKFETLNSYGSAGADLESLPRYSSEFLQNISKPMSVSSSGGTSAAGYNTNPASGGRANKMDCWELQDAPISKDKIYQEKIQNDLKDTRLSPQGRNNYGQQQQPDLTAPMSSSATSPNGGRNGVSGVNSALSIASMEDSPGYHWDCSDWATQKPLSNITEVSMNELRDSSSLHSGESNSQNSQAEPLLGNMSESNPVTRPSMLPGLTRHRLRQHQGKGAVADASEYVGDSDTNQNELDDAASSSLCIEGLSPCLDNSPSLNPTFDELMGKDFEFADDGVESLPSSPNKYPIFHPNHYLPSHRDPRGPNSVALSWASDLKPNICELSEEEDASYSPFHNNNNHLNYGRRSSGSLNGHRGSLVDRSTSSDPNGDQTKTSGIDSMSVSLGGYTSTNASCSDISAHVCEIEDSEANMSDCDESFHLATSNVKQQQVPLLPHANNNTAIL